MKKQLRTYFPDKASGLDGAATGGHTATTDAERRKPSADAANDGNETGRDEWKEGADWDNFGDEEVSDAISETGES